MATTDDTNFILVAIGYILAVVTGLAFVVDVLMLKGSQYILENYVTAFHWCYLISTILSAVALMIFEHAVLPETLYEVLLIAGHSFGYAFNLPIYIQLYCKICVWQHGDYYLQYNCCFHADSSVHSAVVYPPWTQKLDRSSWSQFCPHRVYFEIFVRIV